MNLSNRIESMPYSAIRKLTPYANKAKEAGKKVYHLNIGAPDVETPQEFFDACLLYTSPSPRDGLLSRMPSSA